MLIPAETKELIGSARLCRGGNPRKVNLSMIEGNEIDLWIAGAHPNESWC